MYACGVAARVRSDKDIVEVSVVAKLNSVLAAVCNSDRLLTDVQVAGFSTFCLPLHFSLWIKHICYLSCFQFNF